MVIAIMESLLLILINVLLLQNATLDNLHARKNDAADVLLTTDTADIALERVGTGTGRNGNG